MSWIKDIVSLQPFIHQGDRFILPQADGVIEDSIYLNDTVVITEPVEKVGIIIDIGTTTVAMKWLNLKKRNDY